MSSIVVDSEKLFNAIGALSGLPLDERLRIHDTSSPENQQILKLAMDVIHAVETAKAECVVASAADGSAAGALVVPADGVVLTDGVVATDGVVPADGVVASEATCDKSLNDVVELLASMSPTDRARILLTSPPNYQVLLVRATSILEARKVAKTIAEQQLEIDSLKAALTAAEGELKVMCDAFGALSNRLARSKPENP